MAEIVNRDVINRKTADIGKGLKVLEGDGRIETPKKYNDCLYEPLRNKRQQTYRLTFSSKNSKTPGPSSIGQPSTKRAEGQYSALVSSFTEIITKGSLKI